MRVLLAAVLVCWGSAAAPADGAAWGVVDVPAPRARIPAILQGAACAAPSDCWAVGRWSSGSSTVALALHWDGQSWTAVDTPAPPTTAEPAIHGFNAVTCFSPEACWAVGAYLADDGTSRPLSERWDGTAWSHVPAPSSGRDDQPFGVTCASPDDCWAVGYTFGCPASGCGTFTLALHWDGRAWSRAPSPSPFAKTGDIPFNVLSSVTCVAAADCWAAGYGVDGVHHRPLLLHWDGHRWHDRSSAALPGSDSSAFLGIACTSSSQCWAVGQTKLVPDGTTPPQPLIQRWDGATWSVVQRQLPGGVEEGQFASVACAAASDCVATGDGADVAGRHRTLVERWDGESWRPVDAPSPSTAPGVRFDGVACAVGGACLAVGSYRHDADVTQPLAADVSAPRTTLADLLGEAGAVVDAVACPTASDCWAVGGEIAGDRPAVSHWDGTRWGVVGSPQDLAADAERLQAVACPSAADCWAVGWSMREGVAHPLVEGRTGGGWKRADPPAPPSGASGFLQGVACASPTACWAAGRTTDAAGVSHPWIARWDGASWATDPAHAAGSRLEGFLTALTCSAADDCWAVGARGANPLHQPLVEHWDGRAWTPVTPRELAVGGAGLLLAVGCAAPEDCWAVGARAPAAGTFRALTEHWDGNSWSTAEAGGLPSGQSLLAGIACSAAARCWAVGSTTDGGRTRSLLRTWDGRSWTTVASPDTGPTTTQASLAGIACIRRTPDCRAVGYWADRLQIHPHAAHHPAPPRAAVPRDDAVAPEGSAPPGAPGPANRGARPRLRLRVVPRRVRAGRRTRFRFTARVGGRPVRGARVTFHKRRARTDRRGRAEIVAKLRPGRHRARVAKRGLRGGIAVVRARTSCSAAGRGRRCGRAARPRRGAS